MNSEEQEMYVESLEFSVWGEWSRGKKVRKGGGSERQIEIKLWLNFRIKQNIFLK